MEIKEIEKKLGQAIFDYQKGLYSEKEIQKIAGEYQKALNYYQMGVEI